MVCLKHLDAFKLLHRYLKCTETHQPQKFPVLLLEQSNPTQSAVTAMEFISTYKIKQTSESLHICSSVILLGGRRIQTIFKQKI